MRRELDDLAGASNSPDLIFGLRRLGLDIPCARVKCIDRDGKICQSGIYSLTVDDRRKLSAWLTEMGGQNGEWS